MGARPPAWTGPEDSGVPVGATATFAMTDVVPGTSHYAARSVMTALAGATFDAACPVCALGLGGAAAQAHTKPLRSGAPAATFSA